MVEREQWARAVGMKIDLEELRNNRLTAHDYAVMYFRQELSKDNV